jgi:TPR repeat protein
VLFQGAYDEAMEYFELGMQAGDMRATFQLGVIHYDGLGSKNNLNYVSK